MRALLFDLDGTLVDTVYLHVLAWQRALASAGLTVDASVIHPLIGLPGRLLVRSVGRRLALPIAEEDVAAAEAAHEKAFELLATDRQPLRGAVALLRRLRELEIPHALATSGKPAEIGPSLRALRLDPSTVVIDGGEVRSPKPAPDPLLACQKKLRVDREDCYVVGDTVWDVLAARRARMQPLAVLTGGGHPSDLGHAGASRVFEDPAALLDALEELGFSP